MILYPAIDLVDGKAVRLFKGDYAQMTVYSDDPVSVAKDFQNAGAKRMHLVDLQAAKSGVPENAETIRAIAQETGLFTEAGGGIRSMATPLCIVSVSSTFSGLFDGTGLLDGLKEAAHKLAEKITPFGSLFGVSILTSMISCNQSLAIMLSHSLCEEDFTDWDLAIGMENTVVVIAPLIPWSIAGTVPLASLGAPPAALLAACYLYLIPLWNLVVNLRRRKIL